MAGKKHGNADALSRFGTRFCPRVDCINPGHKKFVNHLKLDVDQVTEIKLV